MNHRSVEHPTIVAERVYGASTDRVFAAWCDPQAKTRWFHVSEGEFELFRVGGWERGRGPLPDGREYVVEASYRDIVPDRRIAYTSDVFVGGIRISVSVATAECEPEGDGTRLVFTEQGAFLDGHEVSPCLTRSRSSGAVDARGTPPRQPESRIRATVSRPLPTRPRRAVDARWTSRCQLVISAVKKRS